VSSNPLCLCINFSSNMIYSKLAETAARQKQREEEAEARRAQRKTGPGAAPAEPPTERTAPRLNLAGRTGGAGGWREKLAAREVAGDAPAAPAAEPAREEAPRRTGGGYVPPHLRNARASSGSASPPPRESSNGPSSERYVPRRMHDPASEQPSAPPAEEPKGSSGKWVPRWKQQQS
jgi:translation initiation factor 3 subunit A